MSITFGLNSACVLFSDESRFSLSSDCRRQLIWRGSGTAYRPENIQEKNRYPTCSIMVWAGIMINGRTRLHVVANGTMTGQRYIDKVLLPHVRLFRGAVGVKFVFMDDNATCHRTLAVHNCLVSEGIQRLVWPARSPDLNPIENVWDALGRQVAGRNYPPTNKNTLIRALAEECDKLPQQLLDNVVQNKAINALESRFDLINTHINHFKFLYNICDSKYTPQNDKLKYRKDLETVLTDGNSPDINALDLADEIVADLALLNKKESPIKILKFRSNLDFAPNLGIVLRILLTLPISVVSGERSFSKLKLIKKFLRSTTTEDRLNGLTTIAIEHELAEEINMLKKLFKKNLRIKSDKETLLSF
ncbi:transposable element Tcb1 transposase [Trichonephila clavipes]|nr:transposable element Tcb1 transposase [Trichonephila clavipes]